MDTDIGNQRRRRGWRATGAAVALLTSSVWAGMATAPTFADGSRNLYPTDATCGPNSTGGQCRASVEWRGASDLYQGNLIRRTLFQVFANQNEYILVGSSAMGVSGGSGNIVIYNPSTVSGPVGQEVLPATPNFNCNTQASKTGRGQIGTRSQELAGPQAISGTGNSTGYTPCYYQAPSTGIYYVALYGTSGASATGDGGPTGDIKVVDHTTTQGTSISAWDITVRSSTTSSTTDLPGRVFTKYLTLFTAGNGRPVFSTIYAVTLDGYQYKIDVHGLDPNGFVMYGNNIGFYDSDGKTPLYHDVIGQDGNVSSPDGAVKFSLPQYPLFFGRPDNATLTALGIPTSPIVPTASNAAFAGNVNGNTSKVGSDGTFGFTGSAGIYQIVISRDGINFDPTSTQNRVLRGVSTDGANSVSWDGKDNSGVNFPVGSGYAFRLEVHGGEYHFPMLDAENNTLGGPTFTLLNPTGGTCPFSKATPCTSAFFDDRGYRTAGGTTVGTVTPDTALCGNGAPSPTHSDPMNGFDSSSSILRKWGTDTGGNANVACAATGSFGDTKGLDLWTYVPSASQNNTLNIVSASPTIASQVRIHARQVHGTYRFNHRVVVVPLNTTVTWVNSLHRSITLASRTTGWTYRQTVAAGHRLSVHFAHSGVFRYRVAQMPAMSGTVVVLSH